MIAQGVTDYIDAERNMAATTNMPILQVPIYQKHINIYKKNYFNLCLMYGDRLAIKYDDVYEVREFSNTR